MTRTGASALIPRGSQIVYWSNIVSPIIINLVDLHSSIFLEKELKLNPYFLHIFRNWFNLLIERSFSVVDNKKKSKGRVVEPFSGLESPQGNKNFREMEDAVVSGDFDPCSRIVWVREFMTKRVSRKTWHLMGRSCWHWIGDQLLSHAKFLLFKLAFYAI